MVMKLGSAGEAFFVHQTTVSKHDAQVKMNLGGASRQRGPANFAADEPHRYVTAKCRLEEGR